jgi:site-specific recombinase XerD
MSRNAQQTLFALVESFFADFLPQQRGASLHTVRAYRDSLKLLLHFIARRRKCEMAKLQLSDLNADAIADFLDHIESDRSNAAATRNCRRAALRSFVKYLLRNDLAHSLQYTQILAIPSKKARQKPATYLEPDDVRAIIAKPDRETPDGWRDYTLLLFLYNCGARVSESTDVRWNDLHLTAPGKSVSAARARRNACSQSGVRPPMLYTICEASAPPAITSTSSPTDSVNH